MNSGSSLTQALLEAEPVAYSLATQSKFIISAGQGKVDKKRLGQWLANDRLYIHAYIRGVGNFLSFLPLPDDVASRRPDDVTNTKIVAWLVDALVNVRREEQFFIDTAASYGIDIGFEAAHASTGRVPPEAKLEGLRRWEILFGSVAAANDARVLPWLEAAIIFWGTEKCYLDAWTCAKSELLRADADASNDADGGALRNEFIDNWTSDEFGAFVDQLRDIIDEAVDRIQDKDVKAGVHKRAMSTWRDVIKAEELFWPDMS